MNSSARIILVALALLSPFTARPAAAEPAAERFVGAAEIYAEPGSAEGIKRLMGQRVQIEVLVTIARDHPLVEIVRPADQRDKAPISAHLVSVTTVASELKKDQRVVIKGVIVDQGYGSYMIYVQEAKPAE